LGGGPGPPRTPAWGGVEGPDYPLGAPSTPSQRRYSLLVQRLVEGRCSTAKGCTGIVRAVEECVLHCAVHITTQWKDHATTRDQRKHYGPTNFALANIS